jgi:hypothetical protein
MHSSLGFRIERYRGECAVAGVRSHSGTGQVAADEMNPDDVLVGIIGAGAAEPG